MFQITEVTATSLHFSWLEPTNDNGDITRYELSCQPQLSEIPPFETNPGHADQTTILDELLPGIRYDCSLAARNGAGSSNLVYTSGTTLETGKSILSYQGFYV